MQLQKWDPKNSLRVAKHIQALLTIPEPQGSIALQGYYPYLRLRVGKYRIIYKYDDTTLYIIWIGKREDIYDKVKKYLEKIV